MAMVHEQAARTWRLCSADSTLSSLRREHCVTLREGDSVLPFEIGISPLANNLILVSFVVGGMTFRFSRSICLAVLPPTRSLGFQIASVPAPKPFIFRQLFPPRLPVWTYTRSLI